MEVPQDRSQILPEIYTSKEQLDRAHDFLMQQLEKVKDDHRSRAEKWREWDSAYRLVDPQRPDEGSAIVDPEIQIEVDTLVANEVEAIVGRDPSFELRGTEDTDQEQAELMTAYIADGHRRIQIREKLERTIRQKKIMGTCFVKTPYVKKSNIRTVKELIEKEPGKKPKFKTVEKEIMYMDDTDWEYVSIFDLYPVGKGADLQCIEGLVHIFEKDYDELLEKKFREEDGEEKGVYHNLENVKPNKPGKLKVAEYWGKIPYSIVTGNEDDRFQTFEGLITAVIEFGENDNEHRNKRAIHSSRTGELTEPNNDKSDTPIVGGIRFQENPFWDNSRPYLSCPDVPIDDELYGVGIVEILYEKWQELNTTIRQVADNKTLQLLNPTIEDANAGVQRNLKLYKNPRIKANDINGIKPLPLSDFSRNGYAYIAQLKDDMRRASGATEGIQGTPIKGEQSATEFAAIQQQAGIRIASRIKLTDERLWKPFIEKCYMNAQQFVTTEKFIRVHGLKGTKFVPVRPDDIGGTFDIVTKGATEAQNKLVMANKYIQYLGIASRLPQFANLPFLLQEIWVHLDLPEKDKHKVVLAGFNETEEDIMNEIEALTVGQPVEVKPNQDHQIHIQAKVQAFQELQANGLDNPENTEAFRQNIDGHAQMLALQGNQARQAGDQPFSAPDVTQLETPNPVEEANGPSAQGAGLASV